MIEVVLFSAIFFLGEVIAFLIFKILNFFFFGKKWKFKFDRAVIKGNLERLFLIYSALNSIIFS